MRFKKNLMHQRKKSVRAQIEIRAFTDQYLSVNGFFPCMPFFISVQKWIYSGA